MSVHELQSLVKAQITERLPYHTSSITIFDVDVDSREIITVQAANVLQLSSIAGACDFVNYQVKELQFTGQSVEDLAKSIVDGMVRASHRPTQGQPHVAVTLRPIYNHIGGVLSCKSSITFSIR